MTNGGLWFVLLFEQILRSEHDTLDGHFFPIIIFCIPYCL